LRTNCFSVRRSARRRRDERGVITKLGKKGKMASPGKIRNREVFTGLTTGEKDGVLGPRCNAEKKDLKRIKGKIDRLSVSVKRKPFDV